MGFPGQLGSAWLGWAVALFMHKAGTWGPRSRGMVIGKIDLLLHEIVVTFRLSPECSLGPQLSLPKELSFSQVCTVLGGASAEP